MAHTSEQQGTNNHEVVSAALADRKRQAGTNPKSLLVSSQNGGQTTISPPRKRETSC